MFVCLLENEIRQSANRPFIFFYGLFSFTENFDFAGRISRQRRRLKGLFDYQLLFGFSL